MKNCMTTFSFVTSALFNNSKELFVSLDIINSFYLNWLDFHRFRNLNFMFHL
jgi:hypothetical protein